MSIGSNISGLRKAKKLTQEKLAEKLGVTFQAVSSWERDEYLPETANEFKGGKNAQDAHEAIRPTDLRRSPESIKASLTREQFMLYRLI